MSRFLALVTLVVVVFSVTADEPERVRPLALFNGNNFFGWRSREGKPITWSIASATWDERTPLRLGREPQEGPSLGELINLSQNGDIHTESKFGSGSLELEFLIPAGSKSGVYLMGRYGIQIADSRGKRLKDFNTEDMGSVVGVATPRRNAAQQPGKWQTLLISYQSPRYEGAAKKSSFKLNKVVLNGELIHENVEVRGPTARALPGGEEPTGPVMLKGDQGPIAFRHIKFTPADKLP